MKQLSPGNQCVPRCLKRMFPGTTYSPPVFFAPRRLPAPSFAPLARPWAWWEAFRRVMWVIAGMACWVVRRVVRADWRHAKVAIEGALRCVSGIMGVVRWLCCVGCGREDFELES